MKTKTLNTKPKKLSRSKGLTAAVRAIYNLRRTERNPTTNRIIRYAHRRDELVGFFFARPDGAQIEEDPVSFFSRLDALETHERAITGRDLIVPVPRCIPEKLLPRLNAECAAVAAQIWNTPVLGVAHKTSPKKAKPSNPHLHLLGADRDMAGQKLRELGNPRHSGRLLKLLREKICAVFNRLLRECDIALTMTHEAQNAGAPADPRHSIPARMFHVLMGWKNAVEKKQKQLAALAVKVAPITWIHDIHQRIKKGMPLSEPEKHRLALARKISRTAGVNPFGLHPAGLELTHRMIEMQREIAPTQTLNFNPPTPGR